MSTDGPNHFKDAQTFNQDQQPPARKSQGPRGQRPNRSHHHQRKPKPRDEIAGVLLVDKPQGITSFAVVEQVRRLLNVRRVGHCGTLDPMATGLLVMLIGEATKVAQFLTDEDKAYEGLIKLGVETDTDDAEGQIVAEKDASHLTLEDARQQLPQFLGTISQKPPRYSAQKRQGVRAYERARAGEEFETESREVKVHELRLDHKDGASLSFACRVGKGTYVRSLAHDLGVALEVGAHVTSLRRSGSGGFVVQDALTLEAIEKLEFAARRALVRPLSQAWLPRGLVSLNSEDIARLRRGQATTIEKGAVKAETEGIALGISESGEAIAVGRLEWDRITRSFSFKPERNLFADA